MINTPDDDLLTLEQVKNQITMGEGEVKRLKGLRDDLEGQVHELVKAKKWNEEEIERTVNELDAGKDELAKLHVQFADAEQVIAEAESIERAQQVAWDEIEKAKQESAQKLAEREIHVSTSEEAAQSHQDQLDQATKSLDEREQGIQAREARLQSLADELRG